MRGDRWPAMTHLLAMTDDVGVLQHATYDIPNRSSGYCTDDVGRALIVACDAASNPAFEADGARLVTTYLSYLHDAQLPDGWFHNFMGYDRRWQDQGGTHDSVGRAVWGLGYAERYAPRASWRTVASVMRRRALRAVARLEHLRARAYAALGLVHVLATRPDDELAIRALLDGTLAPIADAYEACAREGWRWCEDALTYDNARLCEALIRGGKALAEERYVTTGLAMLDFYASVTVEDGVFVPIGNDGWYPRGGPRSRRGQQPLEAAAMVDVAFAALDVTGDERWRRVAEVAHAWFAGTNTHAAAVACETGCCDGIDDAGVNANMGAESTISWLMSAGAMADRSALRLVR